MRLGAQRITMKSEIVASSLAAAIILYVAYFSVGVVIEVMHMRPRAFATAFPPLSPGSSFSMPLKFSSP